MLIEVTRPQPDFIAAYRSRDPEKGESFDLFYQMARFGAQHYMRIGGVTRPFGITENNNLKHYRMWCFGFSRGNRQHVEHRKHYTAIVRLLEQRAVCAVLYNFDNVLRFASVYDKYDMGLFYLHTEKFEISTEALW